MEILLNGWILPIGGFCLLVDLHRKGSARTLHSMLVFKDFLGEVVEFILFRDKRLQDCPKGCLKVLRISNCALNST